MKSFGSTAFIQANLQLVFLIAAFIRTEHMATSGTSSAFLHQETHPGETTADRNGNVITNTSLSLKAVATAIFVPIRNGLISESSIESIATKTTEATMAEDALTQTEQPLVNQGLAKLKAEKGKSVVLPCWYLNYNTSLNKDSVLWYRENAAEKFYPVRDNTTGSGIYSGRVFLSGNLSNGDASLTILNVTKRDNGTYFCTVKLHNGTTLNGDGIHLMVKSKEELSRVKETLGSTIGTVAASTGVFIGLMVSFMPSLRKKMSCQRLDQAQVVPA